MISAILSRPVFIVAVFLFAGLAIKHAMTVSELAEARQNIVSWQVKYSTAVDAQKQSERTIVELQEKYKTTLASLEEWRRQYELIDRKNTAAQRRIRELEIQDESIRNILASRVPDDIWRVLFPKQTGGDLDSNKDPSAGDAGNTAPAI